MSNVTEDCEEASLRLWKKILEETETRRSLVEMVFVTLLLVVIFTVSMIGNILTCLVIYFDRTMQTNTNYYLFNLALTDILATFTIILDIHEQVHFSYQFGKLACKFHYFIVSLLWNHSILIITALAIERCVVIWNPMRKISNNLTRVMKIVGGIWIVAIAESLPELWAIDLLKSKGFSICFLVPTPLGKVVNVVLALVSFIMPLAIMIVVYSMIAMKVHLSEKSKLQTYKPKNNGRKVNKHIIALTVSFMLCWLPFFSTRVNMFKMDLQQITYLPDWYVISYKMILINSWFSTSLNPILFSLMSTKFRKALKNLWYTKIRQKQILELKT